MHVEIQMIKKKHLQNEAQLHPFVKLQSAVERPHPWDRDRLSNRVDTALAGPGGGGNECQITEQVLIREVDPPYPLSPFIIVIVVAFPFPFLRQK